MHHLTELPMDTVTDTTGILCTGGILWRLTCYMCVLLLSIIGIASSATLGLSGAAFLFALGTIEALFGFIVYAAVSSEPTLETDKGRQGDLCLSNNMLNLSLFALIVFANLAFVLGAFWWSDEEGGWGLRGEILGLRDLVRSGWQGYRKL